MFTPRVPGSGSSCHWEAVIISPQSIVLGIIDHATQLYSGLKFKAMKFISPQSTSMKSWFDCQVLLTHMALFSWFVYNKKPERWIDPIWNEQQVWSWKSMVGRLPVVFFSSEFSMGLHNDFCTYTVLCGDSKKGLPRFVLQFSLPCNYSPGWIVPSICRWHLRQDQVTDGPLPGVKLLEDQ